MIPHRIIHNMKAFLAPATKYKTKRINFVFFLFGNMIYGRETFHEMSCFGFFASLVKVRAPAISQTARKGATADQNGSGSRPCSGSIDRARQWLAIPVSKQEFGATKVMDKSQAKHEETPATS